MSIVFSENVTVGTGNISLYKTSDDSLVEAFDVTGGRVTGSGTTTITIDPTDPLIAGTGYYVQIDATAFVDGSDNAFAGIADSTTWNFTTATYNYPVLTYPAINVISNSLYTEIDITETVLPGSLQMTFTGLLGTIVLTLDDLAVGNHTFTIDPTDPTSISEITATDGVIADDTYTITLSHRNAADTLTLSDETTNFTLDTVAPTATALFPTDNATSIALNPEFHITFDKDVGLESGIVSVYKTSDDSLVETVEAISPLISGTGTDTITFTLSDNLLANTEYYIQIQSSVIRSLSGNNFTGISDTTTWSFTTGDYVAPVLTEVTPIGTITTITNAVYHFSASKACTPLAEAPSASIGTVELHISDISSAGDFTAYLVGVEVGGVYSFRFLCADEYATSNLLEVGPFTVVADPVVATTTSGGIVPIAFLSNTPPPVIQVVPTDCLAGYAFSPSTGVKCPNISTPIDNQLAQRYQFVRTLKRGMSGEDVKQLQILLNSKGFIVSKTGAGSPGQETTYLGNATREALIKFQEAHTLEILTPFGLTQGTGIFGSSTRTFVNGGLN